MAKSGPKCYNHTQARTHAHTVADNIRRLKLASVKIIVKQDYSTLCYQERYHTLFIKNILMVEILNTSTEINIRWMAEEVVGRKWPILAALMACCSQANIPDGNQCGPTWRTPCPCGITSNPQVESSKLRQLHRTQIAIDCFTLLLARHLADVSCYIGPSMTSGICMEIHTEIVQKRKKKQSRDKGIPR